MTDTLTKLVDMLAARNAANAELAITVLKLLRTVTEKDETIAALTRECDNLQDTLDRMAKESNMPVPPRALLCYLKSCHNGESYPERHLQKFPKHINNAHNVYSAVMADKIIHAIKWWRAATGMGLKESKEEVEEFRDWAGRN